MTIAKLENFDIINIEENYYKETEFHSTWADNTCELCDVTITMKHRDSIKMEHKDNPYTLTIKPAEPGAYSSYGGEWRRGKGISTEILIDIIQQLTDAPEQVTFENFINRYFKKYGFSHEVKLENSKGKYYTNKPINLISAPKTIKKLMPVYTFEDITPELIKKLLSEKFQYAFAYRINESLKDLTSSREYDKLYGLTQLLRLITQDKKERKDSEKFALLLPQFDLNNIYNKMDEYKTLISVENKNLVYSLKDL